MTKHMVRALLALMLSLGLGVAVAAPASAGGIPNARIVADGGQCVQQGGSNGVVTITVYNDYRADTSYQVWIDRDPGPGSDPERKYLDYVASGGSEEVQFYGFAPGTYDWWVTVGDVVETYRTTGTVTVPLCGPPAVVDYPVPTTRDPCGPDNATWIKPADDATFAWGLENGYLQVAIVANNTVFPDGDVFHDYYLAPDSGVACNGTVVDRPIPGVSDPCNPTGVERNAAWVQPADTEMFSWSQDAAGNLSVQIVPTGYVFDDNSTSVAYGLAPESGRACAPPQAARNVYTAKVTSHDKRRTKVRGEGAVRASLRNVDDATNRAVSAKLRLRNARGRVVKSFSLGTIRDGTAAAHTFSRLHRGRYRVQFLSGGKVVKTIRVRVRYR